MMKNQIKLNKIKRGRGREGKIGRREGKEEIPGKNSNDRKGG